MRTKCSVPLRGENMSGVLNHDIKLKASFNIRDGFLARAWQGIEMAFQPIVNTQTGEIYAFEALMRGHENLEWESIQEVLQKQVI